MRSLVEALSIALFGQSIALPDFPHRPDLKGIGMSCWDGYAIPLAQKLGYTNTYYHQEPFFDIRHPPLDWLGQLDFVISSDVFEHIEPPVAIAFAQARRLLKPGGVMIFTVPYVAEVEQPGGRTIEHFPNLHDYRVEQVGDRFVLHNTTRTGQIETFEELVFHGGPGLNLEMRMFAETDLVALLNQAGFAVEICRDPNFDFGDLLAPSWFSAHGGAGCCRSPNGGAAAVIHLPGPLATIGSPTAPIPIPRASTVN
jgi:SAM-dependent methyltransferase